MSSSSSAKVPLLFLLQFLSRFIHLELWSWQEAHVTPNNHCIISTAFRRKTGSCHLVKQVILQYCYNLLSPSLHLHLAFDCRYHFTSGCNPSEGILRRNTMLSTVSICSGLTKSHSTKLQYLETCTSTNQPTGCIKYHLAKTTERWRFKLDTHSFKKENKQLLGEKKYVEYPS